MISPSYQAAPPHTTIGYVAGATFQPELLHVQQYDPPAQVPNTGYPANNPDCHPSGNSFPGYNQFPVLHILQQHSARGFQRETSRIDWELVAIFVQGAGQMLDVRFVDRLAIAD